jgi:NADH-quinone oxidoreductase subunit I
MFGLDKVARSLLLRDLLTGPGTTFRYISYRKGHDQLSLRADAPESAASRRTCLAAVYQYCRKKLCDAVGIFIEGESRQNGSRWATRYNIDMTLDIHCGPCEEACPVDAIALGPNLEFATETRQELFCNKERLLSNGDQWDVALPARLELELPTDIRNG